MVNPIKSVMSRTVTLKSTDITPTIDIFYKIPISFFKMKKRFNRMAPIVIPILTQSPLYHYLYLIMSIIRFVFEHLHRREGFQSYRIGVE